MSASFPERLKELRARANMSQNALARLVGVDPSYINRIERGEREAPRRDIILQLAAALALDPHERDELLLSADYAPEIASRLNLADPVFQLMAEAIEDDEVEPEMVADQLINLIRQRRDRSQ